MLEVKIYKIVDAGHFYCKPFSRDKIQAEKYYTLIGKINDYCSRAFDQTNNPRSSLPSKSQICLVKRTSDRCWYRARILSVFQTINGPQVRVLLVDLGERTLVPGLWVQEIPEDFLDIPFQTMECVLSGLKPVSLAISYFDLTTTKQYWEVESDWLSSRNGMLCSGCNIQLDVKHIDEDGVHHVLLFATGSAGMICLNDELVNKEFAVPSRTVDPIKQGTNKSPFTKERSQDVFLQEHKDAIKQLNSSLAAESDRSDSSDSFQRPPRSITRGGTQPTEPNTKYQPITSSEVSPGWGNSATRSGAELDGPINGRRSGLSSDEESSKVRFLSARLPATGSSPFPDTSIGTRQKELRPILKTSSGHSSGEQEESARDTATRGERFPRHVENELSSYRPSFGHGVEVCRRREEENVLSLSVPHRHIVNPETLGRNMNEHSLSTQKNFSIPPKPQNVLYTSDVVSSRNLSCPPKAVQSLNNTTTITPPLSQTVPYSSSQFSYASPTSLPQDSFISTSPSSVAGPPQVQSNTKNSLPSQHAPTRLPQSLFVSPTSSSLSPRVPSTNVSQSPRVPTPSPSKSPRVTTAGSSSPPGVTPSPSKSRRVPSSPLPCASLCRVSKDVFIHGEGPPRVISQLDTDAFPDVVLRVLRDMCVTTPSSFQSNIWPAVLRGRDVCGIPETHAGNSLGYLVPVLTEISEPAVYSELPLGNGPLALIICAGWRKASAVYVQCCKFAKKIRNIRVECIFGAGAEEEYILHLINGCEVLIATLPCFLRMFKKGYTRLDRLCHLVLDDADILAEDQTELVKELMRAYGGYLQSQPDRLAPRQCIVMANKWTPGVRSLVKVYLGHPLIIIGNSVETAMFCKVRQTVKMISASKRDSHIVGLLDSLTTDVDHEIIIFTSAAKDAEHIAELLQYDSYSVLLAHEFLYSEQLVEVRRQWNTPHSSQSYPVLVMTDGVIDKCFIRNSSCVIHYDFPHSEKLFGKRLFCMAANYPSTEERECLSHILGTEHTSNYAQRMKQILTRAGGEVPAVLESVSNMAIEAKEECKKNSLLCYSLKALGVCKYMNTPSCKERHTVFPDADVSILLPRSGLVKKTC